MQASEEAKERMRAYYRANKEKWKKYKSDSKEQMSDEERAAFHEKALAYSRAHYQKNREAVIQRTTEYQQKNKEKSQKYRAEWHQLNKQRVAKRRRKHYHEVVKPRQNQAKANSEFVTISEAAKILGAKLRAFREWVYMGRIDSLKTATGRYMLRRSDVEEIQANINHIPAKIRKTLGLLKNEKKS
jgi:excisionase family DNA binding protein